MITLSFSKAMVEGLEKELTRVLGLNNLRLYKIVLTAISFYLIAGSLMP